MVRREQLLGVLFMLAFFCAGVTRAAEEQKTEKEKRREAEAAAEEQLDGEDSQRNPLLRGKVQLLAAANPSEPDVIGLFEADGRRYKLEAASKEVEAEIRKSVNQPLALRGKIRDEGTTFIAEAIEGGGPPPGLIRNPDGL